MCRSFGKYKCGKCYSCLAEKRNHLMIRLAEHYDGICRHYAPNQRAVLFGVLTFDDDFLPPSNFDNDHVTRWQPLVNKFVKRFRSLYPFLEIKYYIGAEFGGRSTKRLHLHPVFFVTPRIEYFEEYFHTTLPKYSFADSLNDRKSACLSAMLDATIYRVPVLRKRSGRPDNHKYDAFTNYVVSAIKRCWCYGLCDFDQLHSNLAVKYVTKYTLKSRDERFRIKTRILDRYWKSLPKKRLIKYIKSSDNEGDKFSPSWHTRVIYKQYLISNGIGFYFFETPQFRYLLQNLSVINTNIQYISSYDGKNLTRDVYVTKTLSKPLRWSDPNNLGFNKKNSYSLPVIWRKPILDWLSFGAQRDALGKHLQINSILQNFINIGSLCLSHNIPFKIVKLLNPSGVVYDFDFIFINPEDKNKINNIIRVNYDDLETFKLQALCL